MIVIDYLRWTQDNAITVPSFHRGHLGFLSGTPVNLGLRVGERHRGRGDQMEALGCELFITPFPPDTSTLFRLTCTLRDQPGAVDRAVCALSALNLNILIQESACVNHLRHHTLNLIVDWTPSSRTSIEKLPENLRRRFPQVEELIPAADWRYFELLRELLIYCGDIIEWKPSRSNRWELPAIELAPFGPREYFAWTDQSEILLQQPVEALEGRESSVREQTRRRGRRFLIPIGIETLDKISDVTGYGIDERMPYILLSDTTRRTLQVFFPRKGMERRTVHVAFSHLNRTGALSVICGLLAETRFNILTSILRKEDRLHNIWEVFLQYLGESEIPLTRGPAEDAKWVWNCLLTATDQARALLKRFDFTVKTPRYPREAYDPSVELPLFDPNDSPISHEQYDREAARQRAMERIGRGRKRKEREWIKDLILESATALPTVFLSYPKAAKMHAEIIKESTKDMLVTDEFQDGNLELITPTVISKIQASDFFLAIWHPEPERPGDISPWLPFEYGVAEAFGKPAAVVASEKLPEKVWRRIRPEVSCPLYNDLTFKEKTVALLLEHIKNTWLGE